MSAISAKLWAFGQMQFGHSKLAHVKGQQFYKLMGSGKGLGFSPWPDWSIYGLFQIWDDEASANAFFEQSSFYYTYKSKAAESSTVFAKNVASHGLWDGANPFEKSELNRQEELPSLVLTRATIKISKLRKFWNYVPTSQKPIANAPGLLYTKGVGEWPLVQMATLSFWKTEQAMKDFAYGSEEHKKAIKMTKELQWYREELFARFVPYKVKGNFKELEALKGSIE